MDIRKFFKARPDCIEEEQEERSSVSTHASVEIRKFFKARPDCIEEEQEERPSVSTPVLKSFPQPLQQHKLNRSHLLGRNLQKRERKNNRIVYSKCTYGLMCDTEGSV
ncbi:hypothetical protein EOD39_5172 [Acipenser ruthenus]|uniref:Uncharacterized protein n=1 Tax=Acipenser ruthenus TaxID=7906 RepID=A0A444TW22_ACIRT|nr:hypothetical protein EOD39_5172 [Acipenser ruthenus]